MKENLQLLVDSTTKLARTAPTWGIQPTDLGKMISVGPASRETSSLLTRIGFNGNFVDDAGLFISLPITW